MNKHNIILYRDSIHKVEKPQSQQQIDQNIANWEISTWHQRKTGGKVRLEALTHKSLA